MPEQILNISLTDRERSVMQLLATGYTERGIATELGISRRTVSCYTASVRKKLGVDSTVAAMAYLANFGLLKEETAQCT